MGSVFVATDILESRQVAVKVLDLATEDAVKRFRREVEVLSGLSHPGIVRYVTHGQTNARESFLVMELLKGENLAERLNRGSLTTGESLILVRKAAAALSFAHDQGIVHRDVKPNNLFLVEGDVERLKVLDFGIARTAMQTAGLTRTGTMLGTVGYMAPEQTMGSGDIDARADVFALGCVLFECLTGRAAFSGKHAIAVLAKVLSAQAPRVSEYRSDVPDELDDLVARMLSKRPDDRPRDLSAVLEVLSKVQTSAAGGAYLRAAPAPAPLTHSEKRIVSIILAARRGGDRARTLHREEHAEEVIRVQKLAERSRADLLPVAGGAFVLVLSGRQTATDQAADAATCALAVSQLMPALGVALATGLADTGDRLPVGPAIDRAAELLRSQTRDETGFGIPIDDVTTGLLGARFDIRRDGETNVLVGEEADFEKPRLLMGKPTPTVGRDKDLATLEATLVECIDDSVARAVLVTAAPGFGKSRLATEFIRKARARGDTRILFARADAAGAGSALALARQLVVKALDLRTDSPAAARRTALHGYAKAHVSPDRADVTAEFLGEIAGIPAEGHPSPILRAARNDAAAMQEQKRRAFGLLMDAESARGPLLLVLEDLHWGDAPTVQYLDEALRRLAERPLMLLALARPEVHDRFPKLWDAAEVQELRLQGLSRRAAQRLVRAVMGEDAGASLVLQIVERADGNAFYLEELIRSVIEGRTSLPETVLAMVQSRLERLEPESRRVLRAASVYGERCWSGGVAALLGPALDASGWLEALVDREFLARSRESQLAGEDEYVFRHALLRDAAYATLTEEDKTKAHRRAGEWLETAGERNARVLAAHFESGGDAVRAVEWLVPAAETALASGDEPGLVELLQRAKGLGASGEPLGRLLAAEGVMLHTKGQPCLEVVRDAIRLLPAGSPMWWSAVACALNEAGIRRSDDALEFVQLTLATQPGQELTGSYGLAINFVVTGLNMVGQPEMAQLVLMPLERFDVDDPACDPLFVAWLNAARSFHALVALQDGTWQIERALHYGEKSVVALASSGVSLGESWALVNAGVAAYSCGLLERAHASLVRAIELAKRPGGESTLANATLWSGLVACRSGDIDHAVARLQAFVPSHRAEEQIRAAMLADALFRQGDLERAEPLARSAIVGPVANIVALASSVLARVHLERAEYEACLEIADTAAASLTSVADLFASKAIALRALGREEEARNALIHARELILSVARNIQDTALRDAFLMKDECRRTLALAGEWRVGE